MTFRARLLVTSVATLAVALGILLVTGNLLLRSGVRGEASALLKARADAQIAALDVAPRGIRIREAANDASLDRLSWVVEGSRVLERAAQASPALDRRAVALGRRGVRAERDGPDDVRLRAQPVGAGTGWPPVGTVVVGISLAPLEHLQQEILVASIIVAVVFGLAGALTVRRALSEALRPVAQMTASAEDWGAHDLDRRFGLGPARDELTGLAATLDRLLARIAASRRHEQRFASEVAHELRTPLAVMRGRAELALRASGPGVDAERTAALKAAVAQAERLGGTVDTMLAVARQELDPSAAAVDLARLTREFDDVPVDVPPGLPHAEGQPDVVRRAVSALVDNARRHARERVWIELSYDDRRVRLTVRDDGAGVDPALGERAFEPGVRGAGERGGAAGLGLPLARRMAQLCGGDVVAGAGPGGCFVLELPAVR